jgi:carbon-monoxide dehydrogenase large subunit
VLLAASRRLGRPVRWRRSGLDGFQSEMPGRGTRAHGRPGLDAAGRFTALDIAYGAALGACVTPVGAQIHLKNPPATLTGVYAIAAAVLDVALHVTNTVPTGPYRGAGRPDIPYALERRVDAAVAATGLDRLELRRRNGVAPTRSPWTTPTGVTYDSGDYPGLVDRAARAADWAGAPARRRAAEARGRLHGIGCALFVEVAGGGGAPHDEALLRLDGTGGALCVAAFVAGKGAGQSHEVTLPRLVAEALGCAPAQVELRESASDVPLVGSGTFGSRSPAAMGTALVDAAGTARRALLAVAADAFGRPVERLDVVDGVVVDDGEAVAPLAGVVATAVQGGGVLEVRGWAPRFRTVPSGCHVAEVKIDRDTGAVTLVGYTAVDDSARVVDHAVPRAEDVPAITVAAAGMPSPANPLGAKGVGEAGTTGAPAAVANAVMDAVRSADAGPPDMPFGPARVWAALQGDR